MMEFNQLWWETIWDNRRTTIVKEMWKKKFRTGTLHYVLGLVGKDLEKVETFFRELSK